MNFLEKLRAGLFVRLVMATVLLFLNFGTVAHAASANCHTASSKSSYVTQVQSCADISQVDDDQNTTDKSGKLGHVCCANHCHSSQALPMAAYSTNQIPSQRIVFFAYDDSFVSHSLTDLFRPPRA